LTIALFPFGISASHPLHIGALGKKFLASLRTVDSSYNPPPSATMTATSSASLFHSHLCKLPGPTRLSLSFQANPALLHTPELAFFKEYVKSLGATFPDDKKATNPPSPPSLCSCPAFREHPSAWCCQSRRTTTRIPTTCPTTCQRNFPRVPPSFQPPFG